MDYLAAEEERPLDHLCLPNEIELGQEYHGKDAEGGDASSAEHSDLSDSEDDGDSDFSYESADEARPKKARRQLPESDDDAPLSQRTSTPRSGSKNAGRGKRKAQQEEEEEEDEETEARRLLARATGAPVDPPTRKSGAASAPKRGGNGGGSHDPELRGKVRSGFQQALDMAAKEIGEADAEAAKGLPATSLVASAIEDALVRLFGECASLKRQHLHPPCA